MEPEKPLSTVEIARWAGFEESPEWCLRLGFILANYGEFEDAIEFLQKSLKDRKGDGIALCTMAFCYCKINKFETAIETAILGISRLSEEQEYMMDWAIHQLTLIYFEAGKLDGFLESGDKLVDQIETVESGNALPFYLAWYLKTLLELKEYKQAAKVQ